MKYDSLPALEKHLEGAKSHQFSPLYLLLGKNAFEIKEAAQLLLNFLMPAQEAREFALSIFDGSQVEESEFFTALYTRSFFSEARIIWVQQAEKLKKTIQDELIKFFKKPSPSQYLILSASGWTKTTNFYQAADKEGVILELAEIKPWEKEKRLADWVNKQLTKERKHVSYQTCQQLVKQIGTDQAFLAQELEKLICYCGAKNEISFQDVEAICTRQTSDSVWQLGEAIFQRNAPTALQAAHSLLMEGQALLPLLRQIRAQFQTEYQICILLSQGKQPHEITQEFPYMKGQILDRHIQQARNYGMDALKKGLLALDAAEMRVKNSGIEDKMIIELLIMKLTHRRPTNYE